jgi:hypothetical protein
LGEKHMPDSDDDLLERYRAQADEMLAVATKTPLPALHVTLFEAMAVAHGIRAPALRNALLDDCEKRIGANSQPTAGRRPARSADSVGS